MPQEGHLDAGFIVAGLAAPVIWRRSLKPPPARQSVGSSGSCSQRREKKLLLDFKFVRTLHEICQVAVEDSSKTFSHA